MVVSIKFESNQDYQTDAITAVTGLFKGVSRGSLGQLVSASQNVDGVEKELFQDVVYGNRIPGSIEFAELVKEIGKLPEVTNNYKNKIEALFIANMFRTADERITESEFDSFTSSPAHIIGQVKGSIDRFKTLPDPAEIFINNNISIVV